jgi:tetratricopeptide (TPR) repeat protein
MFDRARDLDALRFRADSKINDTIRSEAKILAGQGAELLDLEMCLEQNNHNRPLDEALLVDHVHLNVRGNFLAALAAMQVIRETMPQAHLIQPARSMDELYELCLDRMLYNVHEQYRLAMLMYYRKTRPPFAGQIDHDKELVSLRAALVQLRGTAKQNPETESIFIGAVEKSPGDAFLIRRYGDFLMQNQCVTEAIQTYRKYLQDYPFNMNIRIGLAEALASDDTSDKAVMVLTERNTPFYNTRKEALQLVGNLYVKQGRYFEALNIFQELYRIDSHDVHILVNMASAASHMGDFTTAKQALDKALKIAPDSVPAMINMGNYYVRQERTEEAYAWFERAAQADPYNYIPQFSLGMQKLNLGQVRDGLKYITESVNLKPDFVQGYQMLATVYAQFEKVDAARNYEVLRDLFSP